MIRPASRLTAFAAQARTVAGKSAGDGSDLDRAATLVAMQKRSAEAMTPPALAHFHLTQHRRPITHRSTW